MKFAIIATTTALIIEDKSARDPAERWCITNPGREFQFKKFATQHAAEQWLAENGELFIRATYEYDDVEIRKES
jgi:hypothetical protein